ncbi:MAG: hypothetical protein AAB775_02070 [Patescibacteria group bacterium]
MNKMEGDDFNFQKEYGDENGYVMVCEHIKAKSRSILVIEMQIPYDERHSGWEATCNKEDCKMEMSEWPMNTLLEYEPSLCDLIKHPLGCPMIHRIAVNSPWKVIK